MNDITRILPEGGAEKLADWYLPVYLRDWYLQAHPLIQCYLYDVSGTPEEFFTTVLQEQARHMNKVKFKNAAWKNKVKPLEIGLEKSITNQMSSFKQLT